MEIGEYLLKSVTILSIFYGVYYVFLRKDTLFTAKRHYLLGGIVASLFLPFLEFTKTIYREAPALEAIPLASVKPITNQFIASPEGSLTVDWWQITLAIYIIGILLMTGRFFVQLFSLLKLIRTNPSEKRKKYTFVRVNDAISPFSFFRYIVYNPESHSEEELQMILKHEQVHASQWHSIDIIVANVARILQWINPFSWFYKRSLEENLEFIADNETASQVPSKKLYQLTLVRASSPVLAPALTTQFYQSFIKKRIIMLNKNMSKRRNIWKLSIVLPALALFLWSFNVKEVVAYKEAIPLELSEKLATPPGSSLITSDEILVVRKEETATSNLKPEKTPKVTNHKQQIEASNVGTVIIKMTPKQTKDIRIKITKNTTDSELETMKKDLKRDHGVDITYSVKRNTNNEIISIEFSYSGEGNSGSYNIEDDEAIEDFHFYIDDDGNSGFYSEGMEERREERLARRGEMLIKREGEKKERLLEREVEREERRADMENRRKEMEERRVEMEVRSGERAKRMHDQAKKLHKQYNKQIEKNNKVIVRSNTGKDTYIYSNDDSFEDTILINKDTSDAALKKIQNELAAEGTKFNYSKVKRNTQGEITSIKITTNDGKGNKSSIVVVGDEGEPIDEILIAI